MKTLALALMLTAASCALTGAAHAQSRRPAAPAAAVPKPATLSVGAAKVDVTPQVSALPPTYEGIHDLIYARAIVVNDGTQSVAIVTVDAGGISDATWAAVGKRMEAELGIPAKNLFITATHSHNAPRMQGDAYDGLIFQAVKDAKAKLQPAKMGYNTGVSYLNVNRNIIDRKTNTWWEGPNYDGPSDKTVAVLTFETLTGEPIAIYYNYAMHAVLAGQLDLVGGDYPGATSRYLENTYDDKVVAVFSNGAAGDQNPLYFNQTYELRDIRIKEYASRGQDISNAMPPGGQGLKKNDPQVKKLMDQQNQMVLSMGQMLGEEVLHVMRTTERETSKAKIYTDQTTISCPGRQRTNTGRAGFAGTYVDADPIDIRLSLLKIGDVYLGGVNAEIFKPIATRFKRESRFERSMFVSLTNGTARSGYIPNDAAFGQYTFEVVSSRLKPGCAESKIVNGLVDLIEKSDAQP